MEELERKKGLAEPDGWSVEVHNGPRWSQRDKGAQRRLSDDSPWWSRGSVEPRWS